MTGIALAYYLRDRRRSLAAWAIGIVALVIVMALFFPSIRDAGADFDAYLESLPESMRDTLGASAGSITSPEGYLIGQLYSNMYPLLLLVFGISMAAWAIAGSESEGTLEVTLAAPLTRSSLAWGRWLATAIAILTVILVSTASLVVISPPLGLSEGVPWWGPWSAAASMWALTLVYASVAFGVGAATGHRSWALAVAAVLAAVGFLGQLFASLATPLEYLQPTSPWYWFLGTSPLTQPPGLVSLVLPLAVALAIVAAGIWRFEHRDVGA
jgi:ABC-2 type transport system permease protein